MRALPLLKLHKNQSMKKQQRPQRNALAIALALVVLPLATQVQAQTTPPNAGQILQQLQPPIAAPRESKALSIQAPAASSLVLPGGAVVVLQTVSFAGNSVISQSALQDALGHVAGKSFDLAGLRGLAERISDFYRASGYPFARAVLPPQDLKLGALRIEIIEGRYGLVQAQVEGSTDATVATQAQPFLSSLKPGAVIASAALERTSLLLDDLPGIKTAPVIRPGAQTGSGDLMVQVRRDKRFTGDVGLDNVGSRFTGQTRARANLNLNSPFMLGDQIRINTLVSDGQLWLGSLGYSLPVGSSGLRGNVGYSHTSYVLATKEFADLQNNGTAVVASAGLSYPLVRSQKTNLTLSGTYQAKDLQDNKSGARYSSKSSQSVPIALQFDNRDSVGGGGITYGSLGWTPGNLKMDIALPAGDDNNTRGSYDKFNLDLVRLQSLPAGFSLMGRISHQSASKNLDSSEKMSLGGGGAVRAYPTGEASGDAGVLAQLELRYSAGVYAPYVFVDGGRIKTNAKPIDPTANNERNLSGAGVGVRYQRNAWSGDATLAWRNTGGAPQADTSSDPKPRVWVNLGYRF